MDINQLINIVKKKIEENIPSSLVKVEDKTFLHKNHSSHTIGKFHIKITIESGILKNLSKIEKNKIINKIIKNEIKNYIHSIQIHFN